MTDVLFVNRVDSGFHRESRIRSQNVHKTPVHLAYNIEIPVARFDPAHQEEKE